MQGDHRNPLERKSEVRDGRCREALGLLCAMLMLGCALPATAQFRPVPGREYREYHNPANPVRGEAVIGLAIAPTESEQRSAVVQVLLPPAYNGEVRVETATADGRFRGEGVFSGATKDKEWVSLPLSPSSGGDTKAAIARPTNPLSLAISARGVDGTIFVTRWGDAPLSASTSSLRIYVNSRRAEMFLRAGSRVIRCLAVGVPQPVRFDSYCDVLMTDIPRDGQMLLIRRDQFDEQTQALKVQLP